MAGIFWNAARSDVPPDGVSKAIIIDPGDSEGKIRSALDKHSLSAGLMSHWQCGERLKKTSLAASTGN